MICQVDKLRFCDPEATTSPRLIHTVELSDGRSLKHFATFWAKGKERGEPWRVSKGLDNHHQRDLYHRDPDPWLPQAFPGMESKAWSTHYHLDLDHPPTLADLEPFRDEIPEAIWHEIEAVIRFDASAQGKDALSS